MPARLWLVPAAYAATIGAVLLVSMIALFFMGVPGPLPWSIETIIGFIVFLASAVAPAAAALAFRRQRWPGRGPRPSLPKPRPRRLSARRAR